MGLQSKIQNFANTMAKITRQQFKEIVVEVVIKRFPVWGIVTRLSFSSKLREPDRLSGTCLHSFTIENPIENTKSSTNLLFIHSISVYNSTKRIRICVFCLLYTHQKRRLYIHQFLRYSLLCYVSFSAKPPFIKWWAYPIKL